MNFNRYIIPAVTVFLLGGVILAEAPQAHALMAPKYSQAQEAISAVEDWAQAWSSQESTTYLACYAPAFVPENGNSRESWERNRKSRLTKPEFIMVGVGDFSITYVDETHARLSFTQEYRSDRYASESRKEMVLVRSQDSWLIASEHELREETQPVDLDAVDPITPSDLDELALEASLPQAASTYYSIKSAVNDNWTLFRSYFDTHTSSDPYARGDIVMQLTVSRNGRVIGATVIENTAGGEELAEFVSESMRSWHFNAVGPGVFKVKIPFKHTLRKRLR